MKQNKGFIQIVKLTKSSNLKATLHNGVRHGGSRPRYGRPRTRRTRGIARDAANGEADGEPERANVEGELGQRQVPSGRLRGIIYSFIPMTT